MNYKLGETDDILGLKRDTYEFPNSRQQNKTEESAQKELFRDSKHPSPGVTSLAVKSLGLFSIVRLILVKTSTFSLKKLFSPELEDLPH